MRSFGGRQAWWAELVLRALILSYKYDTERNWNASRLESPKPTLSDTPLQPCPNSTTNW